MKSRRAASLALDLWGFFTFGYFAGSSRCFPDVNALCPEGGADCMLRHDEKAEGRQGKGKGQEKEWLVRPTGTILTSESVKSPWLKKQKNLAGIKHLYLSRAVVHDVWW